MDGFSCLFSNKNSGNILAWLAHTFKVLSRLITSLTLVVSLFLSRRTSPVPRSFHSEDAASNLNNLARLNIERGLSPADRYDRSYRSKAIHAHFEQYFIIFLPRFGVHLLSELDYRFEMGVIFPLSLQAIIDQFKKGVMKAWWPLGRPALTLASRGLLGSAMMKWNQVVRMKVICERGVDLAKRIISRCTHGTCGLPGPVQDVAPSSLTQCTLLLWHEQWACCTSSSWSSCSLLHRRTWSTW